LRNVIVASTKALTPSTVTNIQFDTCEEMESEQERKLIKK
jgi:hypothetical protein